MKHVYKYDKCAFNSIDQNFDLSTPFLPQPIHNLRDTYVSLSKLDVYPAAMLEYNETGPGPVFKHVIIDQFTRLRDGDRFWFENRLNGWAKCPKFLQI